jgi:hypothetical protein
MLKGLTILLLSLISILGLSSRTVAESNGAGESVLVAQAPLNYIPWYTPPPSPWPNPTWPAPIPSAYAAIDGAFAAGIVYDTGSGGTGSHSGFDTYMTGLCNFICFGKPGTASSNVFVYGNDFNSTAFTEIGAPDDCTGHCPGSIANSVFGITVNAQPSPANSGYFVSVSGKGNLGIYNNIVAGASVIAGAGAGMTPNPYPSPTATGGTLISYTGTGTGELRMGSAADYLRCDYGATKTDVLTCNAPLMAAKTTTSAPGPVAPCYGSDGTACGSTFHTVKPVPNITAGITTGASGCAANAWCSSLTNATISLSGAAVFTDGNYACTLSSSSTYKLGLMVNGQQSNQFTIQAYNPGSSIGPNIPLDITYTCSGT